jgi:hypothetical protein
MVESKRLRWVRHAGCIGEREMRTKFWWEHLKERDHLKDLGVYEGIILKLRMLAGFICLRIGTVNALL